MREGYLDARASTNGRIQGYAFFKGTKANTAHTNQKAMLKYLKSSGQLKYFQDETCWDLSELANCPHTLLMTGYATTAVQR